MAAHRFWRASVRIGTAGNLSLSEVQFRTVAGDAGSNQSGSATFTGMYSTIAATEPAVLGDGNTSTTWRFSGSQYVPIWFAATWAEAVDTVEVAFTHGSSAGKPQYLFIDASDDGLVWTRASEQGDMSGVADLGTYLLAITDPIAIGNNMAGGGLRIDTGTWPPTDDFGRMIRLATLHYDSVDGGPLAISGTVKIDDSPDIPVRRRVRLFDRFTARLIRETWSDPVTGAYVFSNLKDQKYFVVSHDHTLYYNAVIKDEISPEVPA